ncbi:MAG: alpha/beta fold hydrolase [Dehalococcoidia bacterium]
MTAETTEIKPREGDVQANGLRLHYLDWGNETAPPMLLLHGFTGHAHFWDHFAAAMRDQFHVVALDQRGHGESDWAPEYTMDSAVADIQAVVEELRLQKMILIGLSMGGSRAIHYTPVHPEEVERLVIVDIGPQVPTAASTRIAAGAQARDEFDSEEDAYQQARAANAVADETLLRHRIHHNLKPLPNGKLTWKWDKALRDPSRPRPRPAPEEGWAAVQAIACPTLLIRGAESDVLAEETAERMAREIKNCTLVTIPGSGHPVPMDRPREFEAAVRSWLTR